MRGSDEFRDYFRLGAPSGAGTMVTEFPDRGPGRSARTEDADVIVEVPDTPPLVALTIDDGVSSPVVGAYVALARATGIRLTFFANGVNGSWADHQPEMQPLVDSGQIQIANHTWDHPDIRTLTSAQLVDQLDRNNRYLTGLYGVDTKPYFRPPYMGHTAATDRVCVDQGYSVITWWNGSFGDSTQITADAQGRDAEPCQFVARRDQRCALSQGGIARSRCSPLAFDYGQNQLLSTWAAGGGAIAFDYLMPRDVVRAVGRHGRHRACRGSAAVAAARRSRLVGREGDKDCRTLTNSVRSIQPRSNRMLPRPRNAAAALIAGPPTTGRTRPHRLERVGELRRMHGLDGFLPRIDVRVDRSLDAGVELRADPLGVVDEQSRAASRSRGAARSRTCARGTSRAPGSTA